MMMFLKSKSRSIHTEKQEEEQETHIDQHDGAGGGGHELKKKKKMEGRLTALTVWRKSLVVSCTGFTVIDSSGNLVYRVDNYKGPTKEVILMDAAGKSIFTMKRRRHSLLTNYTSCWVVYEGDSSAAAAWWVKKSSVNVINSVFMMSCAAAAEVMLAEVYRINNSGTAAYVVEGSYGRRSCRVLDEKKRRVAEIRRKEEDPGRGVCFGVEVFQLIVISDALDPAFAMALLVLLDQMFS